MAISQINDDPFTVRTTWMYETAEEREERWRAYSAYLERIGFVEYTQAVHMDDGTCLEYTHREPLTLWRSMPWNARQVARSHIEEECAIALLGRMREYISIHEARPLRDESFWIDATIH